MPWREDKCGVFDRKCDQGKKAYEDSTYSDKSSTVSGILGRNVTGSGPLNPTLKASNVKHYRHLDCSVRRLYNGEQPRPTVSLMLLAQRAEL